MDTYAGQPRSQGVWYVGAETPLQIKGQQFCPILLKRSMHIL